MYFEMKKYACTHPLNNLTHCRSTERVGHKRAQNALSFSTTILSTILCRY